MLSFKTNLTDSPIVYLITDIGSAKSQSDMKRVLRPEFEPKDPIDCKAYPDKSGFLYDT